MKSVVRISIATLLIVSLIGCAPSYSLVKPAPTKVAAGSFHVQPTRPWNRAPKTPGEIREKEVWTLNGLMLDGVTFIGGLKDGSAIEPQNADQRVPEFRASMLAHDLVSMLETYYRIHGVSVFETLSVAPRKFVGESGVQFDYAFIPADDVKRRGRAVMAISNGKLYLMNLNGTAVHYFDAALPEFEGLVDSAQVQ